jgi:peptide/nickel transport system substrate-binding protein
MRYRPRTGFLINALLASSITCGAFAAPGLPRQVATGASASDTVTVAYYGGPASIDPAVSYDYAGPAMMHALYESLVRMRGSSTTAIEGALATSWDINPQETVYTFHLRHGVLFHDGTPFNAAAVKFSIARNLAIGAAPAYVFGQFVSAADVQIVDNYTVRLHLHAPAPRLLYAFASLYGSYMVSPTAIKKHATKADPWAQKWIAAGNDAGSGPYMLTQYNANSDAILTRFPQYWRGWSGHHVSRVIFDFVNEEPTRRELLEKGDADIGNVFTPQDMQAMESNPQLVIDSTSIYANWTIVPTVYGPLASKDARLALEYAFDYNGFLNGLMKGFARPAQGPVLHTSDGHDNALPVYQTDLAKAKQLFTAAGVMPGTTLTLWYSSADESQKDIALVIQGQLGQIGINVKIEPRDSGTYFTDLFGTEPVGQRPNLWIGGWSGDYNDAIAWFKPLYNTQTKDGSAGGANAGLYSNAEVDKDTQLAAVTVDPAKRQQLLDRIQYILTVEDPAAVYVGEEANTTTYHRGLHGYYYNTVYVLAYDFYSMWK